MYVNPNDANTRVRTTGVAPTNCIVGVPTNLSAAIYYITRFKVAFYFFLVEACFVTHWAQKYPSQPNYRQLQLSAGGA